MKLSHLIVFASLIFTSLIAAPFTNAIAKNTAAFEANYNGIIDYKGEVKFSVYNYNGGNYANNDELQFEGDGIATAQYQVKYFDDKFEARLIDVKVENGWGEKFLPNVITGTRNGMICKIDRTKFYCTKEVFDIYSNGILVKNRVVKFNMHGIPLGQ